jgi:hypothetical protein
MTMSHFKLFEQFIEESNRKRITAKQWDKMDDDTRMDSLLGAIKDPDEAEQWVQSKYVDLPSWLTANLFESIYDVIGRKQLKVVIEGEPVRKDSEKILKVLSKVDPENTLNFYEATGKIVGLITKVKMDNIKRDLRGVSSDITIKEKK